MHTTNHECDAMSVEPTETPLTVPIISCSNNTNIFCDLFKVYIQFYCIISQKLSVFSLFLI